MVMEVLMDVTAYRSEERRSRMIEIHRECNHGSKGLGRWVRATSAWGNYELKFPECVVGYS